MIAWRVDSGLDNKVRTYLCALGLCWLPERFSNREAAARCSAETTVLLGV